jgi:tetratricopeptide (TPR) repeat protein/transcriptional regulator with XRE-family HTH domain
MARHGRAGEPDEDALAAFADGLRELRTAAGHSYRALARRSGYSVSTLAAAAGGRALPSLAVTLAYAQACGADPAEWERRWRAVGTSATAPRAGGDGSRLPVPPRELPMDTYPFTGRAAELAQLDALLDDGSKAVVISAVSGTAGVGKTALAVHWAHRVAARFPDGQLYVDLRGYGPDEPVQPAEALAGFLRTLGVADSDIPDDVAERAAAYRTLMAGRRMLLVLDNARSTDQVYRLVPGTPSCFVVVTGRDSFSGLVARHGARRVDLDLLPPDDAVGLLRALVGARADHETAAAAVLAEHCVRLPLALRIAAELAAARPTNRLAALGDELADEQRRLDALDAGSDERTAVRAVFSWSYRHLPAAAARMYRMFGLHPGREIDRYALAALAGVDLDEARRLVDTLVRAQLVRATGADRFDMHDLLRTYARECVGAEAVAERRAALLRMTHHYLATAAAAMDALLPAERHRRPRLAGHRAPAPDVGTPRAAKDWLNAERSNLIAVAGCAASHGWPTHVVYLAATVSRYLNTGGHHMEALVLYDRALRVAREYGDRYSEGAALHNLGLMHYRLDRHSTAIEYYQRALEIRQSLDDRAGVAATLNNLGLVYGVLGRLESAADHYLRALAIHRELADRTLAGGALGNLGNVYERWGRYDEAYHYHRQALDVHREVGDRVGEGTTLTNLGNVHERWRQYDQALACHQQALTIARDVGNRIGEGYALVRLGDLHRTCGRLQEADDHLRPALALAREVGDRAGEALAINALGRLYGRRERWTDSAAQHRRALALARAVGDLHQQAYALDGIARALRATGQDGAAREHWQDALGLFTDLGAPEADEVRQRLADLDDRPAAPGPAVTTARGS